LTSYSNSDRVGEFKLLYLGELTEIMKSFLLVASLFSAFICYDGIFSSHVLSAEPWPTNAPLGTRENVIDLVNSANAHIRKSEYQEARLDLNKAIELEPQNPKLYHLRGKVYYSLVRYEKAIKDYSRAIELEPQNPQFLTDRGRTYHLLQRHEDAIQDYSQLINLNPNAAEPYLYRAIVYYDAKDGEKALQDYNKAIQLEPLNAEAYYRRGLFYTIAFAQTGKEDTLGLMFSFLGNKGEELKYKALNDLDQAIKLNPNSGGYYFTRGFLHRAIYISFSGNILRTFDRGPQKQRALNDYRRAAALFQASGDTGSYQQALQGIKSLD
jgi:tetratricopeptide (TPR) repeat protein